MHALVHVIAELILREIALWLHKARLNVPLFKGQFALMIPRNVIVINHVAEVIQSQIVDLNGVLIRISQVFRGRNVIKLPVMTRWEQLEAIFHKVTVKVHQKTTKSQIVRRNKPAIPLVVDVAERGILGRLQPEIDGVYADQRLYLVRVVELLQ